jgi:hypothetical protein
MMKMNRTILATVLGLAAVSATAGTKPTTVFEFDNVNKNSTFSVTAKGWSDPAFGDAGWTHSSGWGKVTVKKGQTVTITAIADNKSVHPGSTVWYRGADDTADDAYVNDHFYAQNANIFKSKASDDSAAPGADGKPVSIGNIVMRYIAHNFDLDNNKVVDENGATDSEKITTLKGKKDGVPGKLTLSFKARFDGTYMFVVGGFNPNSDYVATKGADGKDLKESVKVSVSIK